MAQFLRSTIHPEVRERPPNLFTDGGPGQKIELVAIIDANTGKDQRKLPTR